MEQTIDLRTLEARLLGIERQLENLVLQNKGGAVKLSSNYLTIQDASKYITKAIPTIYGLVSRREIPHYKIGKHLYFKQEDLSTWLDAGRRKTVSEIFDENEISASSSKLNVKLNRHE